MAMLKSEKVKVGDGIAEALGKSHASIVAEYRGITAEELASLRRELHKYDAKFKVVKNRVAIKALAKGGESTEALKPFLKGPVGLTLIYGDVAQSAKKIFEFSKENDNLIQVSRMVWRYPYQSHLLRSFVC